VKKNALATALLLVVSVNAPPARSQPQSIAQPKSSSTQAQEEKLEQDSSGVTPGVLVKRINPKYPKAARKKHIRGKVLLKGTITKEGDVTDLSVVSGDPVLVDAALEAVKQWKYRPYLLQGKPVEVDTQIVVNFDF
jgi:TonB family protein